MTNMWSHIDCVNNILGSRRWALGATVMTLIANYHPTVFVVGNIDVQDDRYGELELQLAIPYGCAEFR